MAFASVLAAALLCSPASAFDQLLYSVSLPLSRGIDTDMARKRGNNKWDESKVSRGENGQFIAQSQGGHRDNAPRNNVGRDVSTFLPQNNFDPVTTQKSDFKPVKPKRTTIFIQTNGQTYRR